MAEERVNQDGNTLGRIGALVVLVAIAIGLSRLCAIGGPFSSCGRCLISDTR